MAIEAGNAEDVIRQILPSFVIMRHLTSPDPNPTAYSPTHSIAEQFLPRSASFTQMVTLSLSVFPVRLASGLALPHGPLHSANHSSMQITPKYQVVRQGGQVWACVILRNGAGWSWVWKMEESTEKEGKEIGRQDGEGLIWETDCASALVWRGMRQ
ncbi:unnamed protein product [Protopolystoma xenopodis]|uniref:Uncharacterized protein n=1 Tax=Protopolystoma xenopodis TaxID=117903 RepID=A0A3S5AIY3_9PLAT|nr:unnamed protein product [Protopolystoma xenopodis]